MVTIRLARRGANKTPFYHVTVAEKSAPRDGRFIERIGYFNPIAKGHADRLNIDLERIGYWMSVGAKLSERVKTLVREQRNKELSEASRVEDEEDKVAEAEIESSTDAKEAASTASDDVTQLPEDTDQEDSERDVDIESSLSSSTEIPSEASSNRTGGDST